MRVQSSKSAASGACRPKRAPSGNAAFQVELTAQLADQAGISRTRRELLDQAIEIALSGSSTIPHGTSRVQRRIHRLRPNERTPSEGVILRLRSGWEEDIASVEKEIAAAPATDATLHLLIDRVRHEDLAREIAIQKAAESVLQLKGVPGTDPGREARDAMQSRADKAKAAAATLLHEAVDRARVVQAGGAVASGEPADAVREAAGKALARFYPKFLDADHAGWGKVLDSARRKDPDAIKAVDHSGTPETHPVCKAVLAVLGPGRKGSDIRSKFMATPYGWPQDAIDAALTVLGNAGQVRVTGEDGKATSLPDLPRAKLGTCTFRAETTVITVGQRLAVAGLLQESETPFEKNQEAFALSALLGRLEVAAASAGGEPPAPAATSVPNITTLRSLSGNELLAALAASASDLKQLMKGWKQTAQAISTRMPKWRLAERLVAVGADDQRGALNAVRDGRSLLGDPDPVPPIIAAATESLRNRLNSAFAAWEAAWQAGEHRLHVNPSWGRHSPEQRHAIRQDVGLLPVSKPEVDTPQAVAEALQQRSLSEWDSTVRAVPARIDDAIAQAAALLEPKARQVTLPGGLLKDETDLDNWLGHLRGRIVVALADGPVIPRV